MDAQDIEAKLVKDMDKAKTAWRTEKDLANKEGLWLMWKQAEERLYSLRMQLVAGGESLSQGCRE